MADVPTYRLRAVCLNPLRLDDYSNIPCELMANLGGVLAKIEAIQGMLTLAPDRKGGHDSDTAEDFRDLVSIPEEEIH